VGGTAKHCIDQYMVLFCYCSLGGSTAMSGGLHARLCISSYVLVPMRLIHLHRPYTSGSTFVFCYYSLWGDTAMRAGYTLGFATHF